MGLIITRSESEAVIAIGKNNIAKITQDSQMQMNLLFP